MPIQQTIFYRTFYPSTSFGTGLQQQQLSMLGPTMTQQEQNILVVGVVLAALVTLACVAQAVTGVLCTLRSSFLVHWQQQNDGDASSELVWTTYESSPVGTSGNDGGQRRRNSTGGGGGRGGPAISPPSHTSTLPFDDGAGYGHYGGPGSARAARINHAFGANPAVHVSEWQNECQTFSLKIIWKKIEIGVIRDKGQRIEDLGSEVMKGIQNA